MSGSNVNTLQTGRLVDSVGLARDNELERRAKARERLNRDKEVILKRKNDKDFQAFPDGIFELFNYKHIWKDCVLPYFTDPHDISNLSLTCQSLRVLDKQRILSLLPHVLNILRRNQYLNYSLHRSGKEDEKAILSLRLVSAAWKKAVEKEYFEHPFSSQDWYLDFNALDAFSGTFSFCDVSRVEHAISALSGSHSGHCFIRLLTVPLHSMCLDYQEAFCKKLIEFLEIHGHAVWGLFYCSDERISKGKNFESLWKTVIRMPNLKAFHLRTFMSGSENGEDVARLRENVAHYAFPSIPSLEYFGCHTQIDEHLVADILRKNKHIKAVQFETIPMRAIVTGIPEMIVGVLNDLRLERYEGLYFSPVDILAHVEWPLKVLHLQREGENDPFGYAHNYKTSQLWHDLDRFQKTLVELRLWDGDVIQDGKHVLQLPNLKILQLNRLKDENWMPITSMQDEHFRGLISVNDLLSLKSLKQLQYFNKMNIIQVSNIFKSFPNLDLVFSGFAAAHNRHTILKADISL